MPRPDAKASGTLSEKVGRIATAAPVVETLVVINPENGAEATRKIFSDNHHGW